MKPNTANPTVSEILDWALNIFEERVEAKGLELTDEARQAYLAAFEEAAQKAEACPRYFQRYWQNIHRMMRDLGSLSVSAAEWARSSKVEAANVTAAIQAYEHIKPMTRLCSGAVKQTTSTDAVAVA